MRTAAISAALIAAACFFNSLGSFQVRGSRLELPDVILWAWERSEDLRFLEGQPTGVAFLAATAFIAPDGHVRFHPRAQDLLLPPGAPVLAVVRIESAPRHESVESKDLMFELREIAGLPNVRGLQIDFDARLSERSFYRTLLESMHAETTKPIAITALASWCAGDRWFDGEPVDEAVPMFFRMGRNEPRDMEIQSPICRSSIGLSTDEAWPAKRCAGLKHIYLFSPRAWTKVSYLAALDRLQEWR